MVRRKRSGESGGMHAVLRNHAANETSLVAEGSVH